VVIPECTAANNYLYESMVDGRPDAVSLRIQSIYDGSPWVLDALADDYKNEASMDGK
jgi:hypothetical protein